MSTECANEIEEAASEWLMRRDAGAWSESDQVALQAWLDASVLHRVAFLRLELAWEESARLKALGAGVRGDLPPPGGQWNLTPFFEPAVTPSATISVSRVSARGRRALAVAASVLLVAAIATFVVLMPSGPRYTTPVGGVASVPMADGSNVTLNTNSQIRVALTEAERRVELQQGEAFFEVARDPTRPFVVNAGGRRVIAVGTKFSVRRERDEVQVVVTEGKVRIEDAGETLLTPGSIARAGDAGVLVRRTTLPEAEEQLSWRTGVLMFRDRSLADAIAELNRYNTRQIVISDPEIAALRIEGNFRATNLDAFVRLLESAFAVDAAADGDRIVLTAR